MKNIKKNTLSKFINSNKIENNQKKFTKLIQPKFKRQFDHNYLYYLSEKKYTFLIDLFLVLKHCILPFIILLIGMYLFIFEDQVIDVIKTYFYEISIFYKQILPRISTRNIFLFKDNLFKIGNIVFFQTFILIWALNIWYATRTILDISDIEYTNYKTSIELQRWIPRIFGALIFIIIIASYSKAFSSLEDIKNNILLFIICILINIIQLIVYLIWVINRRKILKSNINIQHKAHKLEYKKIKFFIKDWLFFIINYVSFVFLTILFSVSKIVIPRFIGSAAILASSLAIWGFFPIFLIYVGKKIQVPFIFIVLIFSAFCSLCNNNHDARLLKNIQIIKRYEIKEYFNMWAYDKYKKSVIQENISGKKKYPVLLISSEGGGIRSAYWTALILSKFQEKIYKGKYNSKFDNYKDKIKFNDHIFAISSVSGGSLGSATYLGLIHKSEIKQKYISYFNKSKNILKHDFLSPVGGSMCYPEVIQRFLPFPISYIDRSKSLEKSWDKASKKIFNIPFYNLYYDKEKKPLLNIPSIFLNCTYVEEGNRVIISNIAFKKNFCDTYDLAYEIDENPENIEKIYYVSRMRTSTAVLMSARFPYVTPAGRIYKNPDKKFKNCSTNIWGHLDDGGYFENSGTATLFDLFTSLKTIKNELISETDDENYKIFLKNIEFYTLILRNDIDPDIKPSIFMYELLQPVQTIFNTMNSRTPYSIGVLKEHINDYYKDNNHFIDINMNLSYKKVPLGWYLSDGARYNVEEYIRQLFRERNDDYINPEYRKSVDMTIKTIREYWKK